MEFRVYAASESAAAPADRLNPELHTIQIPVAGFGGTCFRLCLALFFAFERLLFAFEQIRCQVLADSPRQRILPR